MTLLPNQERELQTERRQPIRQRDNLELIKSPDPIVEPEPIAFEPMGSAPARLAKRVIDIVVAVAVLIVTLPVTLLVALAIKATSRGPVFFVQSRVGKNESAFDLLKFRTMRTDASDAEHRAYQERLLAGDVEAGTNDGIYKLQDPRVTKVGSVLRRFSIDELPQLINVIKGEMSLVGPRPALQWEVDLFSAKHRQRSRAVPGCSGLWQVSGRNLLSSLEMLDLDVEYVENFTLWSDLSILFRTPKAVLRGDGAR